MEIRNKSKLCRAVIGGLGLLFLQMNSTALLAADDVPLSPAAGTAMGTDILTAGTGMEAIASGDIDFTVPPGATIVQVILYWEGYMLAPDLPVLPAGGGDAEITVNSVDITGTLLTKGFSIGSEFASYAYRDDITTLVENTVGLGPGSKTLTITNMTFDDVNDGAGVMVILDDGTDQAEIGLLEGNDFAYISGANLDRQTTVAQTFNFTPSADERTVDVELMFASVTGDASGGGDRPSAIDVTIGAAPPQTFNNLLDSVDGDEWDSVTLSDLTVPAAVSSITVQAFSEDRLATGRNPASFHWISAGLAVTPPPPPPGGEGCTPGFYKNLKKHIKAWGGISPSDPFSDWFDDAFPGKSLDRVLRTGGGGLKALGRHTVAALLNANNGDIASGMTVSEVQAAFNDVYPGTKAEYTAQKNIFASANESGCPINGKRWASSYEVGPN